MIYKAAKQPLAALLLALPMAWVSADELRKPQIFQDNMVDVRATVSAIDLDTRLVTLTREDGTEVDFVAGDEVKNLAQVAVGDTVTAQYYRSMAISVRPAEGSMRVESSSGGSTAEPGEKPMANYLGEMTVVAEIISIDSEAQTVVLKGLGEAGIGLETVHVQNPANLAGVEVGDQVVITYLEALAIAVTGTAP